MSKKNFLGNINGKVWDGDMQTLQDTHEAVRNFFSKGQVATEQMQKEAVSKKTVRVYSSSGQNSHAFTSKEFLEGRTEAIGDKSIAVISVDGTLYANAPEWAEEWFGLVSATRIVELLKQAQKQTDIAGIGIVFNSPGGDGWAANEIVNTLIEVQKTMPVVGLVTELSASASQIIQSTLAYSIAANDTTMLGSIGTYSLHVSRVGYYERTGTKLSYITADENTRKTDWDDSIELTGDALKAYKYYVLP